MDGVHRERVKGSRDAAATREALLDAGTDLFAERGFEGTTVDAIARRANANKAMIHYHFRNKEGLYRAIVVETYAWFAGRLEEVDDPELPATRRLERFIDVFAEGNRLRPTVSAMILKEILAGGPFIDDEVFLHVLRILGTIRSIVSQGIDDGSFRKVDPISTHLTIVLGMASYFATRPFRERLLRERRVPQSVADAEAFLRDFKSMVVGGLSRGAAAQEE